MVDDTREKDGLTPEEMARLTAYKSRVDYKTAEFSTFTTEDRGQIKEMAQTIKQAAMGIIREHGWSESEDHFSNSFTSALKSAHLDEISRSGKTWAELTWTNSTGHGSVIFLDFKSSDIYTDVRKMHPNLDIIRKEGDLDILGQEYIRLVGDVITRFAEKAGFLAPHEVLSTTNKRVNLQIPRGSHSGILEIPHLTRPFVLKVDLRGVPADYKDQVYELGQLVPTGVTMIDWYRQTEGKV